MEELTKLRQHYTRTLQALLRDAREVSEHEVNGIKQAVLELTSLAENTEATTKLAEKLGVDTAILQENLTSLENWVALAEHSYGDPETSSKENLARQGTGTLRSEMGKTIQGRRKSFPDQGNGKPHG